MPERENGLLQKFRAYARLPDGTFCYIDIPLGLSNQLLTKDDRRKITREKLEELRRMTSGPYYPDGKDIGAMREFLDALATYLPPE